jgi:ubiquinone/menaquinone biosynthesis C-methylase UbiE
MNQRASWEVLRRLPHSKVNLHKEYVTLVNEVVAARPGQVVVDVGGGRACIFARDKSAYRSARIIAVDIDAEELALNEDAHEKLLCDASDQLPLADESAHLVVSSSTVEHLRDVDRFLSESRRVLQPGGHVIHVFPSKWAPYAIVNRILPEAVAQRILRIVFPGSEGILGYRTYYDKCHASAIRKTLERHGFDVVAIRTSYSQSYYFAFFFPVFVLMALYELAAWALGLKLLAADVLVVARRTSEASLLEGAAAPA